jgi:Cytochrome c7 and related cytochrome c
MRSFVAIVLVMILGGASPAMAVENKGAAIIDLDGGSRGVVHFPHHKHQNKLGDCKICHTLFPQEKGAIARLKKVDKLVAKQIMNTLCIKCHKAEKKAGKAAGPVTCTKCHEKG